MTRTVVMIHPGALGDVVLAVPAMKRLRERFPRHKSLLFANEPVGRLLSDCRLIHTWMSLEGPAGTQLFGDSTSVSGELMQRLEHCDFAVAWMQDRGQVLATVLRNCGIPEVRIQSPFCSELKAQHQSDRFLETLDEPAADARTETWVRMPPQLMQQGRSYLEDAGIALDRPLVLVHPGSGSNHKCVSAEVLAPVVEQFRQDGMIPLLVEGPADGDVVASLLKVTPRKPKILRGLDLSLLAGVVAQAELFLGHDSGVTHLAALFRVPTVALFGPTEPERWAPRGDHVTVLRAASCLCRSWEEVRICEGKPCLAVPIEQLIARCKAHRTDSTTPRNLSQCALSPPTPYAKVAS